MKQLSEKAREKKQIVCGRFMDLENGFDVQQRVQKHMMGVVRYQNAVWMDGMDDIMKEVKLMLRRIGMRSSED